MKRQLGSFCGLLRESDVVELMLNADGTVWVDRLGQPMLQAGTMPPATAESFIATVASTLRGTVTRENPILECELPLDGSRFEALIPPVVSAPVFTIRRKASAVFSLREYSSLPCSYHWKTAPEVRVPDLRQWRADGRACGSRYSRYPASPCGVRASRIDRRHPLHGYFAGE
jgi:hypothetical protein